MQCRQLRKLHADSLQHLSAMHTSMQWQGKAGQDADLLMSLHLAPANFEHTHYQRQLIARGVSMPCCLDSAMHLDKQAYC